MDFINFLLGISSITCFSLAMIVLRSSRTFHNRVYALSIFSIMAWIITSIFFRAAGPESVLVAGKVFYSTWLVVASIFAWFTTLYPYRKFRWWVPVALFTPAIVLVVEILTTDNVINNIIVRPGRESTVLFGDSYLLALGFLLSCLIVGLANLGRSYFHYKGMYHLQIKYIFWGHVIAAVPAALTNLILPYLGIFYFNWMGQLFALIMIGFTVYAIVPHRLLDFRLVVTRSIVYTALVTTITASFAGVSYIGSQYLAVDSQIGQISILAAASLIIVLLLQPIKRFFSRITTYVFFRDSIDYPKVTRELTNIINQEIELGNLVDTFSKKLEEALRLEQVRIMLPVGDGAFLALTSSKNDTNAGSTAVYQNAPFIEYLQQKQSILLLDEAQVQLGEVENRREKTRLEMLLKNMKDIDAEVAVPIMANDELEAIVLISNKESGDGFSAGDIELLEVIAPQMSSGIQKALLFRESEEFKAKLEREVKKAKEEWKAANQKLKKLDTAKSEFMSIASHQLRTPLAGIVGYLSMLEEEDYGKVEDSQKGIIHEISDGAQRLNRVVNIFLNVSRIEAGRFVMNFDTWSLEETVEAVCKQLHPTAEKKGVDLVFEKEDLPDVEMDAEKIRDVLLNLIDNAVKYTPSGRVEVRLAATKRTVKFMVHDSGVGIDPEEAKKLFAKFVRGENIARVQPDGSGLGLYISKQIIEGHGGRIWAESKGKDQGATFSFEIPIKADEDAKRKVKEFQQSAKKKEAAEEGEESDG